jgi:phenylacetate-coenzyme A ligase PaaK-like adenylate-forming protein
MIATALRYGQLKANELRSRRSVEVMQRRKFRRLLARLSTDSPYYRRLMRERGISLSAPRLEDFPVLTKETLMERFDEIVTSRELTRARVEEFLTRSRDPRDLMDGRFVIVHTSGTSGTLGFCAYTREEWLYGWTALARATGLGFPKRVAFLAAVEGHFAGVSLAVGSSWLPRSLLPLRRLIRTRLFDINAPWKETLAQLNDYRPTILASYGSALKELALAQKDGDLELKPKRIVCGGDSFSRRDRAEVSGVFGAPVYNLYAATETMIIGLGAPESEEMVLFEDDLIVEREEDRILVTNLFNGTTPLIRYVIPDSLLPAEVPVGAGGRSYPGFRRIGGIVGRDEEKLLLVNDDGDEDFIHPIVIAEFFVEGLTGFRVVRRSPSHFAFLAVPAPGLGRQSEEEVLRAIRRQWEGILARKKMRSVVCDVQLVEHLENDPLSGKFRLVSYEG